MGCKCLNSAQKARIRRVLSPTGKAATASVPKRLPLAKNANAKKQQRRKTATPKNSNDKKQQRQKTATPENSNA
jgi:hypothetical protein